MSVEEPIGFTPEGKLVTRFRFTESDIADIGMANEMWWASPDGQQHLHDVFDSLPTRSITISGYRDPE